MVASCFALYFLDFYVKLGIATCSIKNFFSFAEVGFPNALGLAYKDNEDSDSVLMVVRDGKFVPPADGWEKEGRVYIPQEPATLSKATGKAEGILF